MQSFPDPGGRSQVSTNGGSQPRWRADGKELYFIAPDGRLMAASITSSGALAADTPVALFSTRPVTGAGVNKQQYMVSRDGRFLLNELVEASNSVPITLLLNWTPKFDK